MTTNPKVAGSNPARLTNNIKHLPHFELGAFFVSRGILAINLP